MKNPPESEERALAGGNSSMKMAKADNTKSKKNRFKQKRAIRKEKEKKIKATPKDLPTDAKILETRDRLVELGAEEDAFCEALDKLEEFLGATRMEYEEIDSLTNDLMKGVENLSMGLVELEDIFGDPVKK
uniref:Der GTPase-activating protein YihI n=1 Tax=Caenorhabditis tropicalis TaxID=1561998 RepID=A0A1I7V2P2_9PELO